MFESKINRGRANGYAPLDGSGKVPLAKLPPIQSTIDTGSFATTGSNTFTGTQTIVGPSNSLTIDQINTFGNDSFRISATGSANLLVTSENISLFGVTELPDVEDLGNNASLFANVVNSNYGGIIAEGPVASILTIASGSTPNYWFFDSSGSSFLPGDVNIGYSDTLGLFATSGSLNVRNGNINVSGSLNIESPAPPTLSIGSNYGGGKVAYIMTASDAGYDSNYIKGVIAAEFDQAPGEPYASNTWQQSNAICNNLVSGGFDDWRMPTLNELTKLYTNRIAIGSFNLIQAYWSSTEYLNDGGAYLVNFSDGGSVSGDPKYNTTMATRAVRSFSIPTGNALNIVGNSFFTGNINVSGSTTITGNNGRLIYRGTALEVNPTLAEIHINNDNPWLERFHNDTFSTSSAIMAYFGWNDGRFVFHNESTQSIGLQVNGYDGENGLLVYSDKVAFVNNVEISDSLNVNNGNINVSGSVYFGSGSSITETSSSIIITPAGAAAGQSLVIRPTAGQFFISSSHPDGFVPGESTSIYVGTYFENGSGTLDYQFTGATAQQLGRATTGILTFSSESEQTLTWNIPAQSSMTTFTFSLISGSGFSEQGGIWVNSLPNITVTLDGSAVSENNHIHLVSGDPSMVDIYLGDDDQYVKIEKNGGDVVIGTNLDTKHWRFDTSGSLDIPDVPWNYRAYTFTSIPVTYGATELTFTVLPDNTFTNMIVTVGAGGYGENSVNLTIPGTTFPGGSSPANDIIFNVQTFESAGPVYSTDPSSAVSYVSGTPPYRYDNISSIGGIGIGTGNEHWVFDIDGTLTTPGNILLNGSLIQQVNYAPFGSGSWETQPIGEVTQLDITKDVHLLDVTGIEGTNAWFLPDGLYDGQVVRFALKGDGTANQSLVRVYMNNLRTANGTIESNVDWAPFYCGEAPTGPCRSLATALYIDGAWNIDTDWWDMGY